MDDEIRASIIRALEFGKCRNYKDFCNVVLPDIRSTIKRYPELENCLIAFKEKRIIVVESECSGTFPMLLMSLDDRVDVRMYTTYHYLMDAYGDRIYSPKYEENRLFETLYSQDLYFRFSDLNDGLFFINKCENKGIEKEAFAEIKAISNHRNYIFWNYKFKAAEHAIKEPVVHCERQVLYVNITFQFLAIVSTSVSMSAV